MAAKTSRAFTRYAWAFLAYLVFVILFGAWVRISHSGAGCGSHWPLCDGQVIPFHPSVERIIEYTHRVTSGLSGIFGLVLMVWAIKRFGRHRVTWATVVTFFFLMVEAAVGAGLVLKGLVLNDASEARAVVISLHLVNTLVLIGAAGLAAWWSQGHGAPRWRGHGIERWLVATALVAVALVGMAGAITALGDTLFPPSAAAGVVGHLRTDLSPTANFLMRLRVIHPILAVFVGAGLLYLGAWLKRRRLGGRLPTLLMIAVGLELAAGILNIALAAPGWLQVVHLLLAQALWLALVLTAADVLARPAEAGAAQPAAVPEPAARTA